MVLAPILMVACGVFAGRRVAKFIGNRLGKQRNACEASENAAKVAIFAPAEQVPVEKVLGVSPSLSLSPCPGVAEVVPAKEAASVKDLLEEAAGSLSDDERVLIRLSSSISLSSEGIDSTESKLRSSPCSTSNQSEVKPLKVGSAKEFRECFVKTGRVLGLGSFGKVVVCKDRVTGEKLACKIIPMAAEASQKSSQIQVVRRETGMMAKVAGLEGIVQMRGLYQTKTELCLVMQLCEGGELFDEIVKRQRIGDEAEAAGIFSQVVKAVAACHSRGIAHMDLKPENILYTKSGEKGQREVKLADFGFARQIPAGKQVEGMFGSALYMAPEVISGKYNKSVDVWSLGVILYVMLGGSPPFYGQTRSEIFQAIREVEPSFPEASTWASVSSKAKELIKSMLSKNPKERPSLEDILKHPWMKLHCKSSAA